MLGLIDKVQCDLQILFDPGTWLKNSDNPWNVSLLFSYFITLPKEVSYKILKTNIEIERYLCSLKNKALSTWKLDGNFIAYIITMQ